MTAHHQNREGECVRTLKTQRWQNLKGDYTSSQKQAQELKVRGLEPSTTKNKNHPPQGKKIKKSLNKRASKTMEKTSPFLLQPPPSRHAS